MNLIKIARLGKDNKTAFDASDAVQYFVPLALRATIAIGWYAITNTKHFEQSNESVLDVDGKPTGEMQLVDKPFDRNDITFIHADKMECIRTKAASRLLAAEEDAFVDLETAKLKTTYDVSKLVAA